MVVLWQMIFSPREKNLHLNKTRSLIPPFLKRKSKILCLIPIDGVPGPDGLHFLFYQHFWDNVKAELMAMFSNFHNGDLDILV
jgi:hypothetical protein